MPGSDRVGFGGRGWRKHDEVDIGADLRCHSPGCFRRQTVRVSIGAVALLDAGGVVPRAHQRGVALGVISGQGQDVLAPGADDRGGGLKSAAAEIFFTFDQWSGGVVIGRVILRGTEVSKPG